MNIYDMATSVPWCITQESLEVILAIAARDDIPLQAVQAVAGRKLDNTRAVSYRDGTAIIPINGALVRHGDMFSDVSGAVSVNTLATDFTAALNDRSVRSILLSIDSPGGEVNGIHEFADMIYAARAEKPIQAYISHLGCSAAYWIASACERVVCDATAQVGSIGVVAAVPNPAKDGGKVLEFVSSQSPRKRPDVATEGGRAIVQARVDALAEEFVAGIERNRGVSRQRVLDDFGGGGVFVGRAAVKAGLVDALGSFESTLAALTARDTSPGMLLAAQDREVAGMSAQAQRHDSGRMERFLGWLGGATDNAFDAIPAPIGGGAEMGNTGDGTNTGAVGEPPRHQAQPADVARHAGPVEDPRLAELERRLALANERMYAADADRLIATLIHGNQLVPAVADGWRDLYVACARADDAGGQPALVPALTRALASQPQVHRLTGERLASNDYVALTNRQTTESADGLGESDLAALDKENDAYVARRNRDRKVK